ncbi:hypothetical protein B0H14DRAFT_686750 [Mycena olivaceomarginata]|nr:hypothetical protein B0H14DRAFT_686750 [Mycena olivaceomarginata]
MSPGLDALPAELLLDLPQYLHSIEDLLSLFSTCRALYHACANPSPNTTLRLAANSGRVFFRPHPHLLIAATARQLADWAVKEAGHRYLLEVAIQGGVEKLLELAIEVAGLSMDDIRSLYAYKCDVLNPLNRWLDLVAGPSSKDGVFGGTVCNDPETTLLSWVIYGELFHHSLELAYLPFPQHKPLSSLIRYKWFVYCMPDVHSFDYMCFHSDDIPQFFKDYVQADDDRFQQLSMWHAATEGSLDHFQWKKDLETSPSFQTTSGASRELFTACAMHLGMKSLELLVPGGIEKLEADLERIANGIRKLDGEESELQVDEVSAADARATRLLKDIGDPWLRAAYPTLQSDMAFTLWCSGSGGFDVVPLKEAIRSPPQKA